MEALLGRHAHLCCLLGLLLGCDQRSLRRLTPSFSRPTSFVSLLGCASLLRKLLL